MEAEKEGGSETKRKLYAVKVTAGYENLIGMIAAEKAKNLGPNSGIYSILTLDEMKSFVLVEAKSKTDVISLFYGLKHVRGHVRGAIEIKEIEHFLVPKEMMGEIREGTEVEIVWGPFKGSTAEVVRVEQNKKEVTVVLKDSVTPIPINLPVDYIKIIKK
ncbi:MAG TPA: transcription elongation factor Spt5 [Geobacterales bacterium]|nr:transcription elongation factor Spt5 [Geobacterales bacterium]